MAKKVVQSKGTKAFSRIAKPRQPVEVKKIGIPFKAKLAIVVVILAAVLVQVYMMIPEKLKPLPPEVIAPLVKEWGAIGTKPGPFFTTPRDIACDEKGNVYVADTGNFRIEKFDGNGKFIKAWGSKGANNGQFAGPCGLYFDKIKNNLCVLDWEPDVRIQRFTTEGAYVSGFRGVFHTPYSMSMDKEGNYWITNASDTCVLKYDPSGQFIIKFGKHGKGKGELSDGCGVTVDDQDNFYLVDAGGNRVQKFDSKGTYLSMWQPPKRIATSLRRVIQDPNGQFLYVVDEAARIWVLNKDMKCLKFISLPPQASPGYIGGAAFDSHGYLFLINYSQGKVIKLGPLGLEGQSTGPVSTVIPAKPASPAKSTGAGSAAGVAKPATQKKH